MTAPHNDAIEQRLLAACIEEPDVLEAVEQLEILDFFDYHHQAAFTAVRNLQWAKQAISILAVVEWLKAEDARTEKHLAELVTPQFLAGVVAHSVPYGDDVALAIANASHLRELRERRDEGRAVEVLTRVTTEDLEQARAAMRAGDAEWSTMAVRVRDEAKERERLGAWLMPYHVTFLDDVLRGILPHDLIVLGAPTGLGKTAMALSIGMQNAMADRHVAYFGLEAEPRELERRAKFTWLAVEAIRRNLPNKNELNYLDWYIGRCEHIVGHLNAECQRWFDAHLGGMWTFYRGQKFTQRELAAQIHKVHRVVDLIIVDHLHYVDPEDEQRESDGLGETVKTVRDVSLRIGKPVLLVAHLRKKDERLRKIVPSIDDFHGSSNITKICTQAITIERANKVVPPKWNLSPTYISVLKDRRAGAPPYVALQMFDRRTQTYEDDYTLGRLIKGNTDWEQLKPGDAPPWARGHRQLELEFNT